MPYPAKTIAKARLQYEQGKSVRDIGEKMSIHYQTVMDWVTKYKWVKNGLLTEISQKETESILEVASRIGATKEHVIKKAFELSQARSVVLPTGTGYTQIPIDDDSIDENGFAGLPADSLPQVPDRKYQHEGNKLLADILKLRERNETVINAPSPVIIMAEDGSQVAVLGFDSQKKS